MSAPASPTFLPIAGRWDHRKWGSREDPVRQSDLNEVAGGYHCAKRFSFKKRELAAGGAAERRTISGAMCAGTATHRLVERVLSSEAACAAVFRGVVPPRPRLLDVWKEEILAAAVDDQGRRLTIEWYDDDPNEEAELSVTVVEGMLRELPARALRVVLVEAPFLVELDEYWLRGTIDLAYEPREAPGEIALADWKRGKTRLSQVIQDHGYQTGVYAHALDAGVFWPGDEKRERRIGRFPSDIHIVHLRDYLPYEKVTTKTIDRPEEVAFFGCGPVGTEIRVLPGAREVKLKKDGTPYKERERRDLPEVVLTDRRGPAWYRAKRTRADVAELRTDVRDIVSTVRMGRFVKSKDEHCDRCAFRGPCLTAGYVDQDVAREVHGLLRGVDVPPLFTDSAA